MSNILASPIFIYSIIVLITLLGIISDRISYLNRLSSPVVILFSAVFFSNIGIIPTESEYYQPVLKYFIPLAVPILLFDANFAKLFKNSAKLMIVFFYAGIGTIIGGLIAFELINFGDETYKIISMFVASYIGGTANFIAVSQILDVQEKNIFITSFLVDNVVTVSYFIFLGTIVRSKFFIKKLGNYEKDEDHNITYPVSPKKIHWIFYLLGPLASLAIYFLSNRFVAYFKDPSLEIFFITLFALVFANIFPSISEKLAIVKPVAYYMLFVFLAVIGTACDLNFLADNSKEIFMIMFCIVSMQFLFSFFAAWRHKISVQELVVATNAASGGAATAAVMAGSLQGKNLVVPGILCGTFGYAIATFIGTFLGKFLEFLL